MLVILVIFLIVSQIVTSDARSLAMLPDSSSEFEDFATTKKFIEIYAVANKEEIQEKTTSQLFLNKLREVYKVDDLGRQQRIEERDYYLVKVLNRRNKRTIYHTFCHFKICNMVVWYKDNKLPMSQTTEMDR